MADQTQTDEVASRKILLFKDDMTVKVVDTKNHGDKLEKLQNTKKLRVTGVNQAEGYNGDEWSTLEDAELVKFVVQKEERIEFADLPEDVKQSYTCGAIIPVY
jgi:hypothetical protein